MCLMLEANVKSSDDSWNLLSNELTSTSLWHRDNSFSNSYMRLLGTKWVAIPAFTTSLPFSLSPMGIQTQIIIVVTNSTKHLYKLNICI